MLLTKIIMFHYYLKVIISGNRLCTELKSKLLTLINFVIIKFRHIHKGMHGRFITNLKMKVWIEISKHV